VPNFIFFIVSQSQRKVHLCLALKASSEKSGGSRGGGGNGGGGVRGFATEDAAEGTEAGTIPGR